MMSSMHDPEENFAQGSDVCWKRAKEFLMPEKKNRPDIFNKGTVEPAEIVAGSIGDYWFASALACIAESFKLVRKLIVTQSFQDDGVYKVKLCKGGIWHEITIDDYFPCSI